MKLTNEEIFRLLYIVSDLLHTHWQARNFKGGSLHDLRNSRELAIVAVEKYGKKVYWATVGTIACAVIVAVMILFLFASRPPVLNTTWLMVPTVTSIIITIFLIYCSEQKKSFSKIVAHSDSIFENFGRSVGNLNPLATEDSYHDIITPKVVKERLTKLARNVLEAEADFDRCRQKPDAVRKEIIYLGYWVEKCQKWYEKAQQAANVDFGLELNTADIFKAAAAELAHNTAKDSAS
jgi:hypothetical protein